MSSRFGPCALAATWLAMRCAFADDLGVPPPVIPSDAELEASGARIGRIYVQIEPIFDPHEQGEDRTLFRLADRLHPDTRDSAVLAHLLFRPGDPYSRRVLDETARNLREQRYVREPQVRPIAFHDGVVDVAVIARDVWSTMPGASFGRAGGANSVGFELEEVNLLGFGKQLSLDLMNTVERSSYIVRWHDPGILGSHWRDTVALTSSDDGHGYLFSVERPFFSLDSRWSAGIAAHRDLGTDRFHRRGEEISQYRRDDSVMEVYAGWSRGLQQGWTRRWIAGVRQESAQFEPLGAGSFAPLVPADRRLTYPFLRFEAVQDDFAVAQNRDQIARTEDLCFGMQYALELGWAARAFGSDRDAALLSLRASHGLRLGGERSLFLSAASSGRLENGFLVDALLTSEARYYQPTGRRSLFFASLSGTFGSELDLDHLVTLDGESGLRGYPLHYQSGDSRVLLTVEERFFTPWSLWRIANIGAAVFVDAGRAWGHPMVADASLGWLADAGFGLRLSNSRSAMANVLHLDLAFPLGGDGSIQGVQFLVQTRKSF